MFASGGSIVFFENRAFSVCAFLATGLFGFCAFTNSSIHSSSQPAGQRRHSRDFCQLIFWWLKCLQYTISASFHRVFIPCCQWFFIFWWLKCLQYTISASFHRVFIPCCQWFFIFWRLKCLQHTTSASFHRIFILCCQWFWEGIPAVRGGIGHMPRSCWVSPSLLQLPSFLGDFNVMAVLDIPRSAI